MDYVDGFPKVKILLISWNKLCFIMKCSFFLKYNWVPFSNSLFRILELDWWAILASKFLPFHIFIGFGFKVMHAPYEELVLIPVYPFSGRFAWCWFGRIHSLIDYGVEFSLWEDLKNWINVFRLFKTIHILNFLFKFLISLVSWVFRRLFHFIQIVKFIAWKICIFNQYGLNIWMIYMDTFSYIPDIGNLYFFLFVLIRLAKGFQFYLKLKQLFFFLL